MVKGLQARSNAAMNTGLRGTDTARAIPVSEPMPARASRSDNTGLAAAAPAALLADVAAGLATTNDLAELLGRFLGPLIKISGAQAGAVRVLSPEGSSLQLISTMGLPQGVLSPGTLSSRHCGHCGQAAEHASVVWASDLQACAQRSGSPYFGGACQRVLSVPLRHRTQTLGVYNLFFAQACEPPTADLLQILRSVGELLGLALNNARLEQQILRDTRQQERQAMAADVHDSLGQSLSFVKMRLPLLKDALESHDDRRALSYLGEIREVVSEAHVGVRSLITQLRAPAAPGLKAALDTCAEGFRRQCTAQLEIHDEMPGLRLPADSESELVLIVREALSNIARHARAQRAWIRIRQIAPGLVALCIEDDGLGLPLHTGTRHPAPSDPAPGDALAGPAANGHYGLQIMAERAQRMQARLAVSPRPTGGTCVQLEFAFAARGDAQREVAGPEGRGEELR